MLACADIQIRDPYILPLPEQALYVMVGTTDTNCWQGQAQGFNAYTSKDLQAWDGPLPAFRPPPGFWSALNYWAPEAHRYEGRYYLFASFKADGVCRGTQILVADQATGPYLPHSAGPVTPRDWECLDGTLHVDAQGTPWMVFCHEWVQVGDGEMCAMPLTPDLRAAAAKPVLLFHASEAPWAVRIGTAPGPQGVVTDGPFLYRARNGHLLMLWSSMGRDGYAMGVARSASGSITGPWTQDPQPIYGRDGGHGMVFRALDGRLMMTLHTPNQSPNERPVFIPLEETDDGFRVPTPAPAAR
jgi:beta-xylosidase